MKMYPRYIFIILLMILLVSCTKSEGPDIIASKMRVEPFLEVNTKSLIDNSNITEKSVGMQITDFSGTSFYNDNSIYNKTRLTYSSTWVIDDGLGDNIDVTLTSNNARIYAFSPFSTNLTGIGESAFVDIDISREREEAEMIDYLWCSQSTAEPAGANAINSSNPNVYLKLNHSTSIISFVIYKDGYQGDGILTKFEIIDNSLLPSLRVNKSVTNDMKMKLSDGSITGGEMVSSMTVNNINSVISLVSDPGIDPTSLFENKNCHILIAPMTISDRSKLEFCFTIDGKDMYVSLDGVEPLDLLKGNSYLFKVKLREAGITIDNFIVVSWDSDYTNDEYGGTV